MKFIQYLSTLLISLFILKLLPINACQIDNKMMHACLHTYLERDFSIIEELLKRPPYSNHGHVILEESEYDVWCSKLSELKHCYEKMMSACTSFVQFNHMKRVIRTLRSLNDLYCGQSTFLIRYLIDGGYCIEYVRKQSDCNSLTVNDLPEKQRWPLTLAAMFRFEVGKNICPYLLSFTGCLSPLIDKKCTETTRELWNKSMNSLLKNWC